jgi:AmiR/NasT family two-component response regulator
MSRPKRKKGPIGAKITRGDMVPNLQNTECVVVGCRDRCMAGRKYCETHTVERIVSKKEAERERERVAQIPVRTRQRSPGALS